MWIVINAHEYYPRVYEFDDYDLAKGFYDSEVESETGSDGCFECCIYIAEVNQSYRYSACY